jgi:hypothetical protein
MNPEVQHLRPSQQRIEPSMTTQDNDLWGLHKIAPVEQQPTTHLIRWQLFRVRRPDGKVTRHLIGHAVQNCEGRVSSAIATIDPQRNSMVTSSGRVYEFDREPCEDVEANFMFRTWLNTLQCNDATEITGAYQRLQRIRGLKGPAGG